MSNTRGRVCTALVACALLLAACGDGDRLEVEEAVTPTPASPTPTPTPDAPVVAGETPDAADDVDEPVEEDALAEPDDLSEHRPTEDVGAVADCMKIIGEEPGAFIAFPSEEGPGWLEAGPAPVLVEFLGCSNTFEANVVYEASHDGDAPTVQGFTMGGTMGQWEEFRFEETFEEPGQWTVVVFEVDAESGERLEYDEVTITVE